MEENELRKTKERADHDRLLLALKYQWEVQLRKDGVSESISAALARLGYGRDRT